MGWRFLNARGKPVALSRGLIAACAGLAAANLLGALLGGLLRLGALHAGGAAAGQALALHGALMMAGFFATLVTLERVVALRRGRWIPLLSGGAGLLALAGQAEAAALLWLLSAAGLLELYLWAGRHRAWSLPLAVEASAALALLGGAAAHAAGQAELARWGWSLFLVLTIAGERRELMRLLPLPPWAQRAFLAGWAGLALAGLLMAWRPELGRPLGFALLGLLALWLLRFDLARLQWRATGWASHTAICLLVGYGWLLAAALSGLAGQGRPGGIAWHLLWLGFVFAMVFGHAPIMLPALAGLRPRHSRWALLPLGLLGLSLLMRSAASLWGWPLGLALAGAGHGLALLCFGLTMAWLVARNE
jgi:hypothetical protein